MPDIQVANIELPTLGSSSSGYPRFDRDLIDITPSNRKATIDKIWLARGGSINDNQYASYTRFFNAAADKIKAAESAGYSPLAIALGKLAVIVHSRDFTGIGTRLNSQDIYQQKILNALTAMYNNTSNLYTTEEFNNIPENRLGDAFEIYLRSINSQYLFSAMEKASSNDDVMLPMFVGYNPPTRSDRENIGLNLNNPFSTIMSAMKSRSYLFGKDDSGWTNGSDNAGEDVDYSGVKSKFITLYNVYKNNVDNIGSVATAFNRNIINLDDKVKLIKYLFKFINRYIDSSILDWKGYYFLKIWNDYNLVPNTISLTNETYPNLNNLTDTLFAKLNSFEDLRRTSIESSLNKSEPILLSNELGKYKYNAEKEANAVVGRIEDSNRRRIYQQQLTNLISNQSNASEYNKNKAIDSFITNTLRPATDDNVLWSEVNNLVNELLNKHPEAEAIKPNINTANRVALTSYKQRLLAAKRELTDALESEKTRLRRYIQDNVTDPTARGNFSGKVATLQNLKQAENLQIEIDQWLSENGTVRFPRRYKNLLRYNEQAVKNLYPHVTAAGEETTFVDNLLAVTNRLSSVNNVRVRDVFETNLYKFSALEKNQLISRISTFTPDANYFDSLGRFMTHHNASQKAEAIKNEWSLLSPIYKDSNIIRSNGFFNMPVDRSTSPTLVINKPRDSFINGYLPLDGSSTNIPDTLNSGQYEKLRDYVVSFQNFLINHIAVEDVKDIKRINEKATYLGVSTSLLPLSLESNTIETIRSIAVDCVNHSNLEQENRSAIIGRINSCNEPGIIYSYIRDLIKQDPRNLARERITNKLSRILGVERKNPLQDTWNNIVANQNYRLQDIDDLEAKIDDRLNGNDEYTKIDEKMKQIGLSDPIVQQQQTRIPNATEEELQQILNILNDRYNLLQRKNTAKQLANQLIPDDANVRRGFYSDIDRANTVSDVNEVEKRIRAWSATKTSQDARKEEIKNRINQVIGDERKQPLTSRWNALNTTTYDSNNWEALDNTITDRISGNPVYNEILGLIREIGENDEVVVANKPLIPDADVTSLNSIKRELLNRKNILNRKRQLKTRIDRILNNDDKRTFLDTLNRSNTKPLLDNLENDLNAYFRGKEEEQQIKQRISDKINLVLGDERKTPLRERYNALNNATPFNAVAWNNLERDVDDRITGNNLYTEIKGILTTLTAHADNPTIIRVNNRLPDANVLQLQNLKEELGNLRSILSKKDSLISLAGNIQDTQFRTELIQLVKEAETIPRLNELERLINTHIRLNSIRREALDAIADLPIAEPLRDKLSAEERGALTTEALVSIRNRARRRKEELEAPPPRPRKPRTEVEVKPKGPKVPKVKHFTYQFDPTGKLPANLIQNERHTITPSNRTPQNVIIPGFAPFFRQSLIVTDMQSGLPLLEGIDYTVEWPIHAASHDSNLEGYTPLYGGIQFIDPEITGQFEIQYQTVGGQFALDGVQIAQALANQANDPLTTTFESLIGRPIKLPPLEHVHSIEDFVGFNDLCDSVDRLKDAIVLLAREDADSHPSYETLLDTYFRLEDAVKAIRANNDLVTDRIDTALIELQGVSGNLINNLREEITQLVNTAIENQNGDIGGIRQLINEKHREALERIGNVERQVREAIETDLSEIRRTIAENKRVLDAKIDENVNTLTQGINGAKQEASSALNAYKEITNRSLSSLREDLTRFNSSLSDRITPIEAKVAMRITDQSGKLTYGGKVYLNTDDLTDINRRIEEAKNSAIRAGNTAAGNAGADWNTNLRNIPSTLHYSTNRYVTVTSLDNQYTGMEIFHGNRRWAIEIDPNTKRWKLLRTNVNTNNDVNKGQEVFFPITPGTQTVVYKSELDRELQTIRQSITEVSNQVGSSLQQTLQGIQNRLQQVEGKVRTLEGLVNRVQQLETKYNNLEPRVRANEEFRNSITFEF